ncbi:hypothetical protein SLA2020_282220 [Shorea laevis]
MDLVMATDSPSHQLVCFRPSAIAASSEARSSPTSSPFRHALRSSSTSSANLASHTSWSPSNQSSSDTCPTGSNIPAHSLAVSPPH